MKLYKNYKNIFYLVLKSWKKHEYILDLFTLKNFLIIKTNLENFYRWDLNNDSFEIINILDKEFAKVINNNNTLLLFENNLKKNLYIWTNEQHKILNKLTNNYLFDNKKISKIDKKILINQKNFYYEIKDIFIGKNCIIIWYFNNNLVFIGNNYLKQNNYKDYFFNICLKIKVAGIAISENHYCLWSEEKKLYSGGKNNYGQLGKIINIKNRDYYYPLEIVEKTKHYEVNKAICCKTSIIFYWESENKMFKIGLFPYNKNYKIYNLNKLSNFEKIKILFNYKIKKFVKIKNYEDYVYLIDTKKKWYYINSNLEISIYHKYETLKIIDVFISKYYFIIKLNNKKYEEDYKLDYTKIFKNYKKVIKMNKNYNNNNNKNISLINLKKPIKRKKKNSQILDTEQFNNSSRLFIELNRYKNNYINKKKHDFNQLQFNKNYFQINNFKIDENYNIKKKSLKKNWKRKKFISKNTIIIKNQIKIKKEFLIKKNLKLFNRMFEKLFKYKIKKLFIFNLKLFKFNKNILAKFKNIFSYQLYIKNKKLRNLNILKKSKLVKFQQYFIINKIKKKLKEKINFFITIKIKINYFFKFKFKIFYGKYYHLFLLFHYNFINKNFKNLNEKIKDSFNKIKKCLDYINIKFEEIKNKNNIKIDENNIIQLSNFLFNIYFNNKKLNNKLIINNFYKHLINNLKNKFFDNYASIYDINYFIDNYFYLKINKNVFNLLKEIKMSKFCQKIKNYELYLIKLEIIKLINYSKKMIKIKKIEYENKFDKFSLDKISKINNIRFKLIINFSDEQQNNLIEKEKQKNIYDNKLLFSSIIKEICIHILNFDKEPWENFNDLLIDYDKIFKNILSNILSKFFFLKRKLNNNKNLKIKKKI